MVSGKSAFHGTHYGHGADAIDQAGGNKPLGDSTFGLRTFIFQPITQLVQPCFNPEHFSHKASYGQTEDDHQNILCFQRASYADQDNSQSDGLNYGLLVVERDSASESQADKASCCNGQDVDKGSKHSCRLLSYEKSKSGIDHRVSRPDERFHSGKFF